MECGPTETTYANSKATRSRGGDDWDSREEYEWLHGVARSSPVALFRADAEGRCIYVNERWTELTGYPQEAALGSGWERAIHPADLELVRSAWERARRAGLGFHCAFRYLRPDGSVVPVLGQSVEDRDAAGQIVGYISTVTDITELRKMREELQRSHADLEERMRAGTAECEHMAMIVAASADAIVSSNLAGAIVSWNQAAETIFGYSAKEMIGQTSYVITPPGRREEARMIKERTRRGERVDHLETIRVARSGELIEVAMSIFPLRDADGTVSGTSAVIRDIGAQKKAERRLREMSGRLLRLQDEERRRFARDLHDSTAQSLAALSMNLTLLHENDGAVPPAKRAGWVADSLALAEAIARELRTHAYLLHPPLLDERGLVPAVRWFVEGFAARSGIAIDLKIAPEIGRLRDAVELTIFRIVQASLSNVHRHAKSATAQVRLARADGWITVEVRDAGCGIPGDVTELVGVGVAGMRERLAPLGGTLTIESSGAGTAITARIPDQ